MTVRAGQDADGANDTGTLTHTASGGGYANVTKDLPVAVTDDDQAGVAVSFDRASYRVLEGDAVTVGVTLSGDPKRTVVIHLVATEEGGASSEDYSGVPSSVTINEGGNVDVVQLYGDPGRRGRDLRVRAAHLWGAAERGERGADG